MTAGELAALLMEYPDYTVKIEDEGVRLNIDGEDIWFDDVSAEVLL